MKIPFIKKGKKKTPQKNQVFYARENIIQTVPELNKILNRLSKTDANKTIRPIEFYKQPLTAINEQFLKDQFGEVSFLLEPETSIEGNKVHYYKMTSEHLKFMIQVHFIDDEFFMASTKVYGNALLSDEDKLKVSSTLINKYCPGCPNSNDFIAMDEKGNVVFINDDVFYHIIYVANNKVSEQLRVKYSDYTPPKPGQELKETLDDLI